MVNFLLSSKEEWGFVQENQEGWVVLLDLGIVPSVDRCVPV